MKSKGKTAQTTGVRTRDAIEELREIVDVLRDAATATADRKDVDKATREQYAEGLHHLSNRALFWSRKLNARGVSPASLRIVASAITDGIRFGINLSAQEHLFDIDDSKPHITSALKAARDRNKANKASVDSKKTKADDKLIAEWTEWINSKTAERRANDGATRDDLIGLFRKGLTSGRQQRRFNALLKKGRIS